MSSNLNQIIDNPILKSNRVVRYSGLYQAEPETLSEHIVSVMLIAYQLATDLISLGETSINLGLLLEKGLLHDIDEVLTGDIPRPTKYATKESKSILDNIARASLCKIPKLSEHSIEVWESAKDKSPEGFLIRLADMLDVYKKIRLEVTKLNNYEFCGVVLETQLYFKNYDWIGHASHIFKKEESVKYVVGVVESVLESISDILTLEYYRNHEFISRIGYIDESGTL